ncbi:class I SAM-dependent methyltransferase [Sphaerisporangium sp. TRM90804]|uniref:class I SAM-dependent methyltransferase n=1 Tax=Sphaerisporangium sp. TRM90804 TaxID=3031113 RepID=UPI002446C3AE|nr:class I SAM-dependent methyltransferase [Sphaerisporangium sp. TRM90804]MDH2427224.1 class I SAM-dependent methyltransferase [Sphaerisporangium sp. TRM90804]
MLARSGHKILGEQPPDGAKYWAARFWDRDLAERDPLLGEHYRAQKADLAQVIEKYARDADRVIEFACGTGEFTGMMARLSLAKEIVALDISAQGLEKTRARVGHPGLRTVLGDFWEDHDLGTADVVMCVDAIHHIGDPRRVMERMKSFVRPGGVFIGNLWTVDNFHEFQRQRYGALWHLGRSAMFLGSAMVIKASGGRLRSGSYRTRLMRTSEIEPLLRSVFGEVLHVCADRYFVSFACRVEG